MLKNSAIGEIRSGQCTVRSGSVRGGRISSCVYLCRTSLAEWKVQGRLTKEEGSLGGGKKKKKPSSSGESLHAYLMLIGESGKAPSAPG